MQCRIGTPSGAVRVLNMQMFWRVRVGSLTAHANGAADEWWSRAARHVQNPAYRCTGEKMGASAPTIVCPTSQALTSQRSSASFLHFEGVLTPVRRRNAKGMGFKGKGPRPSLLLQSNTSSRHFAKSVRRASDAGRAKCRVYAATQAPSQRKCPGSRHICQVRSLRRKTCKMP